MRTVVRALSALLFLLLLVLPLQAQEQSPIEITAVTFDYTFGQQATFSIEIASEVEVAEVYLYLEKEGEERIEVIPVPFGAGTSLRVEYQRDVRLHPLPPFGEVSVWWEVRDTLDRRSTTPPSVFRYADNRFEWHTISDDVGSISVHTVLDDPAYTQAALDIARSSLTRIAQTLSGSSSAGVHVYVYSSLADLRAAMEMGGREWMGGQARPELGVVLVAIPRDDEFVARMEQDIPHELTHLMLYQVTGPEGYGRLPDWLNEGLAIVNQTRPDPNLDALLEQARLEGRLIPLTDLCAPFPSDPQVALLSYAQSAGIVRFIRDRYGSAAIHELVAAYADGASCEGGIVRALDTNPERLDLAWRAHLTGLSGWATWLSDNAGWLLLWVMSLLLALPMAGIVRRRKSEPPR